MEFWAVTKWVAIIVQVAIDVLLIARVSRIEHLLRLRWIRNRSPGG